MWIRTQNKQQLMKVINVYAESERGKVVLIGEDRETAVEIGTYSSMEEAIAELDNLQTFIDMFPDRVYQVR